VVTKEEVISRGMTGRLFSPKTTKHTHKFKDRLPTMLKIPARKKEAGRK